MMKLNLGPILRARGMTQTAFADAIGVQKGYVSELISGKKSPSFETFLNICEVLNITASEAFGDAEPATYGFSEDTTPHIEVSGFSESQAKPWQGQPVLAPEAPVEGLSKAAKHAATYEITRAAPSLGLLAGDVLVVDLGQPPQSGDLILIGVTDPTGTETITLIRRYIPPFAISADASEPNPVINLDSDGTAAWRATIKSMFRPTI